MRINEQERNINRHPLFGMKIAVTRSRTQMKQFADMIEELGGTVCPLPTIDIKKFQYSEQDQAIRMLLQSVAEYDWLVFTSVNGVRYFMELLAQFSMESTKLANVKLAAVGPQTAKELESYQLTAGLQPIACYQAEGLLDALKDKIGIGSKVLLARGNLARSILPDTLSSWGAEVKDLIVYETVAASGQASGERAEILQELAAGQLDMVTFTSSSTVTGLLELMSNNGLIDPIRILSTIPLASIGPLTSATLQEKGLVPAIEAKQSTLAHLLQAIVLYCERLDAVASVCQCKQISPNNMISKEEGEHL